MVELSVLAGGVRLSYTGANRVADLHPEWSENKLERGVSLVP